jgi:hypothetical protein
VVAVAVALTLRELAATLLAAQVAAARAAKQAQVQPQAPPTQAAAVVGQVLH